MSGGLPDATDVLILRNSSRNGTCSRSIVISGLTFLKSSTTLPNPVSCSGVWTCRKRSVTGFPLGAGRATAGLAWAAGLAAGDAAGDAAGEGDGPAGLAASVGLGGTVVGAGGAPGPAQAAVRTETTPTTVSKRPTRLRER